MTIARVVSWSITPFFFLPILANFAAAPCDIKVRTSPNGTLQWICETGACTNCDITGTCSSLVVPPDPNKNEAHLCLCADAGGATSGDACTTQIIFNVGTGVAIIDCVEACCGVAGTNCVDPAPGTVYAGYQDPCGC